MSYGYFSKFSVILISFLFKDQNPYYGCEYEVTTLVNPQFKIMFEVWNFYL